MDKKELQMLGFEIVAYSSKSISIIKIFEIQCSRIGDEINIRQKSKFNVSSCYLLYRDNSKVRHIPSAVSYYRGYLSELTEGRRRT